MAKSQLLIWKLRTALILTAFIAALSSRAHATAHRHFKTSDGVHLHYLEAGKGSTIVFIPGWMMPAEIWQGQIGHFARSFHVVALDPRSQGRSDKVAQGHYPERLARDIKELVEHVHARHPVLVGWSLATRELLAYAEFFGTDSVGGLVFVDGYIDRIAPTKEWLQDFQSNRPKATAVFVRGMYHTK
jgi:non-heme chloroperoxidase